MSEYLSPGHQTELATASEMLALVLAGKSLEAALLEVRKGISIIPNDTAGDVNNIIRRKEFEPPYNREHPETLRFTKETSNEWVGTVVINVDKLGQFDLGRREVAGMLNGTIPKPVEYKNRQPINGKKQKLLDFLDAHFGHLLEVKAIYADELKNLNPSLYAGLLSAVKGGISTIMPIKPDRVLKELSELEKQHPVAHRLLASNYLR